MVGGRLTLSVAALLAVLTTASASPGTEPAPEWSRGAGLATRLGWESAASVSEVSAASVQPRAPDLNSVKALLLPGWGQLEGGRKTAGYIFLAAEALLAAGIVSQIMYQDWLEEDYRTFAAEHAGVNGEHSHQFYVDIGNWDETDGYNQQRLRSRQFEQVYTAPQDRWRWDTASNRGRFENIRIRADSAGQRAMLMVGGVVLNHLASFIDGSRSGGR